MHPRTVAIVVVVLLAAAIGLRVLVVRYSLLPVSEEAVLKNAVAITVGFFDQGSFKTVQIDEPEQVQDVLGTLRIVSDQFDPANPGGSLMTSSGRVIDFHFPQDYTREYKLDGKLPFVVDRGFYRKLNEVISQRIGREIDILDLSPELERHKMLPIIPGTEK